MKIPKHLYETFKGYWDRGIYRGDAYGDALYKFLRNYPLFDSVEAQFLLGNLDYRQIEAWIQPRLF